MKKISFKRAALFAASLFLGSLFLVGNAAAVQPSPLPAGRTYYNSPSRLQTTAPFVVYSSAPAGAVFISTSATGSPLSAVIDGTGIKLYDLNYANFLNGPTMTSPDAHTISFSVGGPYAVSITTTNGLVQMLMPPPTVGEKPTYADILGTNGMVPAMGCTGFVQDSTTRFSVCNGVGTSSLLTFNAAPFSDPWTGSPMFGGEQDHDGISWVDNLIGGGTFPGNILGRFLDFNVGSAHNLRVGYGGVSINTTTVGPSTLTVNGRIESLAGGFKYPDGSIQTTASVGGSVSIGATVGSSAANQLLYTDGSQMLQNLSAGTSGYMLVSQGTGNAPIWVSTPSGGGGISFPLKAPDSSRTSPAYGFATGSGAGGFFGAGGFSTVGFSGDNGSIIEGRAGGSGTIILGLGGATGIQMFMLGAGALTSDAAGNITSVSDENAKEKIRPFTRSLESVTKIHPVTYRYRESSGLDTMNDYTGFTTQDVEKAVPEAVFHSKRKGGYSSLWDRAILAALVNSVKELKAENDALKARVETLERNGK